MKTKSIRWQLSLSYAGIALLATLLLGMILLGILARYFAIQESNYLIETANEIGAKVYISLEDELDDEKIIGLMEKLSFYVNAQIRLLGADGVVVSDSGLPQSMIDIRVADESEKEAFAYPKEFSIGRSNDNPFSSWLFSIQEEDLIRNTKDEEIVEQRSQQVITQAYYNKQGQILGYVELSNGPAFGRDILRSVAWGWGIAALIAVLLAATAGMWVSRRFSAPLENLTRTTTQMAAGNLSVRAGIEHEDEFGLLSSSFNQMANSIESKVEALRRFVADAAHELHSPLTALRANVELSETDKAIKQVDRMDDLTRRLLDLSKLEADTGRSFGEVDLTTLILDLAEPYASQAEQKEIHFNLKIECDSAKIKGDANQL